MFKALFGLRDRTHSVEAAAGLAYAYRPSLIGAAHRCELADQGLAWRNGRRSGTWAYVDIASIRLSYRPMGMQQHRFRADINHTDGRHITIFSTSKQTVALMEPQAGYAAFMVNLHDRMAAAGSPVMLRAGLRPGIYNAVVTMLVLLALAMSALLVRALWTGEWAGAAFIVAFSGLFAWQIRGFLRWNRPRSYTFEAVPEELLR